VNEGDGGSEELYRDEHGAIGAALADKLAALHEEAASSGRSSATLSYAHSSLSLSLFNQRT
jgi:hypothetical protein